MATDSKLAKTNGNSRPGKIENQLIRPREVAATNGRPDDFAEAVVRTARDPLLVLSADLRVEVANEAFYTTFKVRRDESIGRSVFDLDHHHWDIPRLRELLEDILPRHSFFNDFEVTHNFEHIGYRTMLLNARTLKDSVGHPQRVLLGIQDITESLHFQAETRRSEIRFRRLFETSIDGILLIDPRSRLIIDANSSICRLLGATASEIIGKQLPQLGIFRNEREVKAVFDELEASGFSRRACITIPTFQSKELQVEWVSNLYHDGAVSVLQCNIRDITARIRVGEELKTSRSLLEDSELRYRTLFNSIDEGFCVVEIIPEQDGNPLDYIFLECNQSFEKQAGFSPLGRRMREISPGHEEFWFDTFGRVASAGGSIRFVHQAAALNRWFDVFAFPAGPSESRKVAVLFRDVTSQMEERNTFQQTHLELKSRADQLEKAVAERTADLTAAYRQLEDFAYSIAHDLRAPLRSMGGFSTLLLEEANANLSEECKGFAARINASAISMDGMLGDLIAFTGVARQTICLAPVNLENVVRTVVANFQRQVALKNAHIEIIGPWPPILAHERSLIVALIQLLENSLKFVSPGIQPAIKIRAEENGDFIRGWIEDNGIGIDPQYHAQIFNMFTKLNGDTYEGNGIGLAVVKKAVERMSGQTGVHSNLGQGSRFWFDLSKPPSPLQK